MNKLSERLRKYGDHEAADALDMLEEAVERAIEDMTCRRDDDAHYCPNCDNSSDEARERLRAALANIRKGQEP